MRDFSAFSTLSLAQSPAPGGDPAAPAGGSGMEFFLVIILLYVGLYFLFVAPSRKKQKELQKQIAEMKGGEEILTSGGLIFTVVENKGDRFVVKNRDGTRFELIKSYVVGRTDLPAKDAPASDKK